MGTSLYGRPRRRTLDALRARHLPCWLCDLPIDYRLDGIRHRLAFTGDEVIPRSQGGSTTDPANVMPAHRTCNSFRGGRPVTPELRRAARARLLAATPLGTRRRAW